jgi:hypothetical protein
MVSTTDLDEVPQLVLLLPPVPEPVPGDEPLASRGHPGGPGFAPLSGPAGDPAGASVWQRAQATWLAAGAEWSGSLTAPSRAKRISRARWASRPRPRTRGPLLTVVGVVLILAAVIGGYEVSTAGRLGPRTYPAAQTGQFAASTVAGAGVFQTLTQVASSGRTVVAVGRQAGGDLTRAQFLVSTDAGKSWRLAPVRAAAGGDPAPGHPAQLVAGGAGGWLAVGPQAIWTSTNGRSWTLARTTGITPVDSGDQVQRLVRTATGYVATGQNTAEGTGVIWTSADGLHWQRRAAQALLAPGHGTIVAITGAAAHGRDILLSGLVSHWYEYAGPRITVTWLSTDYGRTWHPVSVPTSQGAGRGLTGVAAGPDGFVAVRASAQGQAGIVYASANGSSWHYATTLASASGLKITAVNGGDGGYSVLGQGGRGTMYGFTSNDGTHWKRAASFGPAPDQTTGSTVTASGVVVATGAAGTPTSERPYLAVAGPGHAPRVVSVATIAGATITQTAATAVAADGRQQVAVGETGGTLAVWSGTAEGTGTQSPASFTPGTWATATGQPPAVAGTQGLTSVAHGPAGWLATGDALAGTTTHPVAVSSPDGRTWQPVRSSVLATAHAAAVQVAADHDGYVVVGRATTSAGTIPAIWFSGDLQTWTRVSPGPSNGSSTGPGTAAAPGQLLGVASGTSGFVAVGAEGIDPAVWTSADGRHWAAHALKIPGTGASAQLSQVAVNRRTVVAFGQETWASGRQAPFAEVSHNGGRSWTLVPFTPSLPHRAGSGPVTVTAVTAMSGGFTAVGGYGPPGDRDVVVWTSGNGNGWLTQTPQGSGLSGPGIQQVSGLAATGSALTGVGFTASATAEQPTLWPVPAR